MVHCFQFNPDALHIMAIGGQKNGVKLWNLKSGMLNSSNILESIKLVFVYYTQFI